MNYVWLYAHGESAWRKIGLFNELEYSIRSVQKNAPPGRYFVVGDKPEVSMDVTWIDSPRVAMGDHPHSRGHLDKQAKFRKIINSPEIGEDIVIMCDDIFILKPQTEEDLKINWAKTEVTYIPDYLRSEMRTGTVPYKQNWKATYDFIFMIRAGNRKKTYDWETHTPRFVEKSKFKDMLERYDFTTNPMFPISVYDGLYAENSQIMPEGMQADLWSHTLGMDFDPYFECTYMHIYDNIIVPEFVQKMKEMFG